MHGSTTAAHLGRVSLACLLLAACSDAGPADGEDGGGGVVGETWVEGSLTGQEAPGTLLDRRDASDSSFGARIHRDVLTVDLPGPGGLGVQLTWQTAGQPIPGYVSLDAAGQPASVSAASAGGELTDDDTGSASVSTEGKCPSAVGDPVSGAVSGVTLVGAGGSPRWTVDLEFGVVVTAVSAPALNCTTGGLVDPDAGQGGGGPSCPHLICDDRTLGCCPYQQCLDTCKLSCRLQDCTGEDRSECQYTCLTECVENTCAASGACRTAVAAFWRCQADHDCLEVTGQDQCSQTHCCEELGAAF